MKVWFSCAALAMSAAFSPAAVLLQMTQQNSALVLSSDASVTAKSQTFDSGDFGSGADGVNAANEFVYHMNTAGASTKQATFNDSLGFSSTTSKFTLSSVTLNYMQWDLPSASGDKVNISLSVNGQSAGTVATAGGGQTDGTKYLSWDLSTLPAAVQNLQSYTLTFSYSEVGSGNITELDVVSKQSSSALQGIAINGTSSPTPEPASLTLLGVGAVGLLRRRRC